ncbi:MAG TPA: metalloregulator ArsR/SmtB family transcription factor [Pseudolysinimonas sp.]|jgi:DNA-binding transcriptional ArsR family regulator|nr:metalloregulator ArsR/SmtB family transcription factor [Pseudolysinimonas sp.]
MHIFTLLGEPVRLRIVEHLAQHEQAVWQLVATVGAEFSVGQSAISKHLSVLRQAGFVEMREFGLQHRYRLAWDAMERLDSAVEALFVMWEDRRGWPYDPFLPPPPPRLDRAGRKGLRGRTRAEIEPEEHPWAEDQQDWEEEEEEDATGAAD